MCLREAKIAKESVTEILVEITVKQVQYIATDGLHMADDLIPLFRIEKRRGRWGDHDVAP